MANVYQFSQSSLRLLQDCIDAAATVKPRRTIWTELFKSGTKQIIVKEENISCDEDCKDNILISMKSNDEVTEKTEEPKTVKTDVEQIKAVERICAVLETARSSKLDCLTNQYNYENVLPLVADNLTSQCLESFCEELLINFESRYEKILLHFIPVFIKRVSSSEALTWLVRGTKTYPSTIVTLTESLFLNPDVPSKLLEEFFRAVDEKISSQFLQAVSMRELPTKVFIHHLITINYLYKNCNKTPEVQNFVLHGLSQNGQLCIDDKNYGRLLLSYFQALNETEAQCNRQLLEQILNYHRTPFKRLCQVILGKLLQA